MEPSRQPHTPDSQHRHLDPPDSDPSERHEIDAKELPAPNPGSELPQPSNRGDTNNIDSKI